ncbi:unnamed protein product [Amoebophrya sp. A25]|nr:unnamed protein product [Amoebophrya sp. A25]|eukprot:GSA25T00021451001.1
MAGGQATSSGQPKLTREELLVQLGVLKECVLQLEKAIESISIPERDQHGVTTVKVGSVRGQNGEDKSECGFREKLFPRGAAILDIFEQAGITVDKYKGLKDACDKVISALAMQRGAGGASDVHSRSAKHTEKFSRILATLFGSEEKFLSDQQQSAAAAEQRANPNVNFRQRGTPIEQQMAAQQETSTATLIEDYRIARRKMLDENYRVQIIEEVQGATTSASKEQNPAAKKRKVQLGWDIENTLETDARDEASFRRTLFFWCFTSQPAMQELIDQGVRSVIITSGTLSPMDATKKSLGVPFNVELLNTHVIRQNQVLASVLPRGPTNCEWLATYQNRQNESQWGKFLSDLGSGLANFAKVCPAGMLIAFSSYSQMEQIVKHWTNSGVKARIETNSKKKMLQEPRRAVDLPKVWQEYQALCEEGQPGAILCAIARGKLTEGVDFSDRQCRCVAVVGLPYPSLHDQRVVLKQQFLRDTGVCDPGEWYQQQALKAVNQTVGRVIRHRGDFGCVLLCDKRFAQPRVNGALSAWLRGSLRVPPELTTTGGPSPFGKAFKEVHAFFSQFSGAADVAQLAAALGGTEAGKGMETTTGGSETSLVNCTSSSSRASTALPLMNTTRSSIQKATASSTGDESKQIFVQAEDTKNYIKKPPTTSTSLTSNLPGWQQKWDKEEWTKQAEQLLDDEDFDELKKELLPALRRELPVIVKHLQENPQKAPANIEAMIQRQLSSRASSTEENSVNALEEGQTSTEQATEQADKDKTTSASSSSWTQQHDKGPVFSAVSGYCRAMQEIRVVLLPALCFEDDFRRNARKRLVYNFRQFVHPKFRTFWAQTCKEWIQEKRLGSWAENIF